jgi:hypothetical protein
MPARGGSQELWRSFLAGSSVAAAVLPGPGVRRGAAARSRRVPALRGRSTDVGAAGSLRPLPGHPRDRAGGSVRVPGSVAGDVGDRPEDAGWSDGSGTGSGPAGSGGGAPGAALAAGGRGDGDRAPGAVAGRGGCVVGAGAAGVRSGPGLAGAAAALAGLALGVLLRRIGRTVAPRAALAPRPWSVYIDWHLPRRPQVS